MLRRMTFLMAAAVLVAGKPPRDGALLLAGGGVLPDALLQAFVEAAGGPAARVAVLPMASAEPSRAAAEAAAGLARAGGQPVTILVTQRSDAAHPELLASAATCTGFWFTGGDQARIGRLLAGTPLHGVLLERYRQGAAVGGTSAGAAALGRLMITGEFTAGASARYGREQPASGEESVVWPLDAGVYEVREGLDLLPEGLVDTHFLARRRYARLQALALDHRDLLGLGIDEGTALLIRDRRARVLGRGRVWVVDPSRMRVGGGGFRNLVVHLLGPGQILDLVARSITDERPLP